MNTYLQANSKKAFYFFIPKIIQSIKFDGYLFSNQRQNSEV